MKYSNKRTLAAILMVVALALAGYAAAIVKPASAANTLMATIGMKSSNAPKPTCPAPFVFSGKKASCVPCPQGTQFDKASSSCKPAPTAVQKCTTTTDAKGTKTTICVSGTQATVAGKKASASALVSGSITILADSTVKGGVKTVQIHSKGCKFYRTFKNSGKDANGHLYWFVDHNGTLCPSKASPSGMVKVSGGKTGRPCMNPAAPMTSKFKVIKGTVLLVKSFANINVPIRASVSVLVQDSCGHAAASVLASASISLRTYARAKGNVSINTFGKTVFSLKESVAASISCGPTQTITTSTTTPGPTTTVHTTTSTTTTVQTTTTTPPPAPKPQVSANVVQEITASDYSVQPPLLRHPQLCGTVKATPGHVLKVSFKGYLGKFDNPDLSDMTADGTWQTVCNIYTSPADTSAKDHFTIYVTDASNGQSSSDQSNDFPVVQADSNPG